MPTYNILSLLSLPVIGEHVVIFFACHVILRHVWSEKTRIEYQLASARPLLIAHECSIVCWSSTRTSFYWSVTQTLSVHTLEQAIIVIIPSSSRHFTHIAHVTGHYRHFVIIIIVITTLLTPRHSSFFQLIRHATITTNIITISQSLHVTSRRHYARFAIMLRLIGIGHCRCNTTLFGWLFVTAISATFHWLAWLSSLLPPLLRRHFHTTPLFAIIAVIIVRAISRHHMLYSRLSFAISSPILSALAPLLVAIAGCYATLSCSYHFLSFHFRHSVILQSLFQYLAIRRHWLSRHY